MSKKYEMIPIEGSKFSNIIALRDFGDVKAGYFGGIIQKEENLSHEGNCWVYAGAIVRDDAKVAHNAKVYGRARVYTRAFVGGNAKIFGSALIYEDAMVYDNAEVFDRAIVYGSSKIHGRANIYDNAEVFGKALVRDNVCIFNRAKVSGDIAVFGDTVVKSSMSLRFGFLNRNPTITDLLRCSLGVYPANGSVRLFKRVCEDLRSEFDPTFQYPARGIVECPDYDPDPEVSCGKGLHFSTCEYWPLQGSAKILVADINLEDIICVLENKARVKKATIIDVIDYKG